MTPAARLLDNVDFKCLKCGAPMGKCDCWQKCTCGWSYEKGKKCRNPIHKKSTEVSGMRRELLDAIKRFKKTCKPGE